MQDISGIPQSSTLEQIISGIPQSSTLEQVTSGIPQSSTLEQVISGTSIPRQFVPCRNYQKRARVRSRVLRFRQGPARLLAASRFDSPLRAQT